MTSTDKQKMYKLKILNIMKINKLEDRKGFKISQQCRHAQCQQEMVAVTGLLSSYLQTGCDRIWDKSRRNKFSLICSCHHLVKSLKIF